VEDNGPGMSAEFVRDRLFKPFTTTKTSGMGIGTYESQQYVTSIGGQIEVESQPGRTAFRVSLRAVNAHELAMEARS
jgi:signal transduction histidine kinase